MARPRSPVTDEDIAAAAAARLARHGLTALTLKQVADDVGLVPATLLVRFSSKAQLLLATTRWSRERMQAMLRDSVTGVNDGHAGHLVSTLVKLTGVDEPASIRTVVRLRDLGMSFKQSAADYATAMRHELRCLLDADRVCATRVEPLAERLFLLYSGLAVVEPPVRTGQASAVLTACLASG
ncbi:AcrR family transcriptional regulator [Kibdelosporangium banguiense]|uniref:AcrR family transcriptional regulator n=1 Tax=Kibdelosporangium banguiense TaxID=1365924 RepID=A0ABS4TYA2_9PSEU|nr:TetR family transcriptional regulator [Kibdelosporangium banguiense]MBP2329387.1 AcrR family transcriptional regulator [Kibdelosporangium banguiense]